MKNLWWNYLESSVLESKNQVTVFANYSYYDFLNYTELTKKTKKQLYNALVLPLFELLFYSVAGVF